MNEEALKDLKVWSFEKALKALETVVKQLEEEKLPLEEAIQAYEKGVALKKHCEEKLQQAKMKIEQISEEDSGSLPKIDAL